MTKGLNVGRLVRVSVNLQPLAAARRGFGTLLIIGDSDVIGTDEGLRAYVDLESVAGDFGLEAPEYKAAALYFGQTPRPQQLMIGRMATGGTPAVLRGAIVDAAQTLATLQEVTDGSFTITVDGETEDLVGLDFSACTNLNGCASVLNEQLSGSATCQWTGERFVITTERRGGGVAISYGSMEVAQYMRLDASSALPPVDGTDGGSPVETVQTLADKSGQWYGCMFATAQTLTEDDILAVSEFIEGASITRIFGVTTTDSRVLDATYEQDIASKLKSLSRKRTCVQYSANPYAAASLFGRAFSVNFAANRSTITLMYKQEPGVVAADITETQAQTLKAKRCNVFAQYMNDTAIIQYGVMSGQAYFDEVHGLDWFADALQTELYNLLYQSKTKIPQTDAGQNQLVNCCNAVCAEAVNNGLAAPGQWNADGFGQIDRGDYLPEGYYIYTPPMAEQAQSTREQRIAPPIQIALKLAGAIHEIDAIVDVNR